MNGLYFQSVIEDRQREVNKIVEYNRIYSQLRDSATNQRESAEKGKNVLSLWLLRVGKRIKGVFEVRNKSGVNL